MKIGDEVRFRDDATSAGEPVADLYKRMTWVVEKVDGDACVLGTKYKGTAVKMHTLTHKLRAALPEEKSS